MIISFITDTGTSSDTDTASEGLSESQDQFQSTDVGSDEINTKPAHGFKGERKSQENLDTTAKMGSTSMSQDYEFAEIKTKLVLNIKAESTTQDHGVFLGNKLEPQKHKGMYHCLRCNKDMFRSHPGFKKNLRRMGNRAVFVSQWLSDEGKHYTVEYIQENYFCNSCYSKYFYKFKARYEGINNAKSPFSQIGMANDVKIEAKMEAMPKVLSVQENEPESNTGLTTRGYIIQNNPKST